MNDDAKLRFSPEEIRLVTDPGWILTKNSVMEKVVQMMAALTGEYREIWAEAHITAVDPGSPKISRGENYRGLPWVMLDYPRIFGRQEVMAIRTMFWWGHGFIVTLHLKGSYRQLFLPALESHRAELAAAGFRVGISEDEWRHEHAEETYGPLDGGSDLSGNGFEFLKLSAILPIDRWSAATEVLRAWFTQLVDTLAR
jgi:hypothetical protein